MIKLTANQKYDALKTRYLDQVSLLRSLTKTDFQLIGGYISLQLGLAGWLSQQGYIHWISKLGISLIDLVLSIIATILVYNNFKRRREVVATLKNTMTALEFDKNDIYLSDKPLNAPTVFRPWNCFYQVCIWIIFFGVLIVTWGEYLKNIGSAR
jgi:small-conductance mechanosensitive channel